jgi:hypothetical protein
MFKLAVLGLAAFGAYRLYELLRPRAGEMREQAGSQLQQVADTARVAASEVRDDLETASQQLKDDLTPPARVAKEAVEDTVDTARTSIS